MNDLDDKPVFSEADLRLFRYTAIAVCAVAFIALVVFVFWVLAWVLSFFYNVLLPLAIGGVLALVMYPAVPWLGRRLRLGRAGAVVVLSVAFLLAAGALLTVVVPVATAQVREFVGALPELVERWSERFPVLVDVIGEMMEEEAGADDGDDGDAPAPFADVPATIMSYFGLVIGLGFVPLYIFFALLAGDRLQRSTREALTVFRPETSQQILYLGGVFLDYVTAFFRGQLLIALTVGVLFAAGFSLIGLQPAILLGLTLGLFSIVPYLGSILGLLIVLPFLWLQPDGNMWQLLMALGVFAVVQLVEVGLLRSRMMTNRAGLHPVVVIVSIFFWGTALGVIGMILAVPLTAFVMTLWRHLQGRSLRRVVIAGTEAYAEDALAEPDPWPGDHDDNDGNHATDHRGDR